MDDLDQAIAMIEAAVGLTPDDHPIRMTYLTSLHGALQVRFKGAKSTGDLHRIINLTEQGVASTPDNYQVLDNLGDLPEMRSKRPGSVNDFDREVQ